jgi:hypothetical protein
MARRVALEEVRERSSALGRGRVALEQVLGSVLELFQDGQLCATWSVRLAAPGRRMARRVALEEVLGSLREPFRDGTLCATSWAWVCRSGTVGGGRGGGVVE